MLEILGGALLGGTLTLAVIAWQMRHRLANAADTDYAAAQWRLLELLLRSRGWRNVTPDLIVSLLPDMQQAHEVDA
jgi:hypothetical protein